MADPLKIMDKIERLYGHFYLMHIPTDVWQSLRTALKRQDKELAHTEANEKRLRGNADNLTYQLHTAEAEIERQHSQLEAQAEELSQKEARIARLEFALDHIKGLEDAGYPARLTATEILYESRPQSLAAIKAAVLREAAFAMEANGIQLTHANIDWLRERANRIEREAKEES